MAVPNRYRINVARQDGLAWNQQPHFTWFCTIDAGNYIDHAKKVAEAARDLFPAPEFKLSFMQDYEHTQVVDRFEI